MGQIMKREEEARKGHPIGFSPLAFGPGKLGNGTRNCDEFAVGRFIVPLFGWRKDLLA